MGAYTDPKVYTADPTAFQKGFMSTFGEFLKEQKKVEEQNEQALNNFTAGFFNSDQFQEADDAMRDELGLFFKDQQEKFIAAKPGAEKQRIASETIAKAKSFQSKFQNTIEARGNAFAKDYLNRPIADFMTTSTESVPKPKYLGNGKFGMSYGDNKILTEDDMYQNAPEKIEDATKAMTALIDSEKAKFNEDYKGRSVKELDDLRQKNTEIIYNQLSDNQKLAIGLLNDFDDNISPEDAEREIKDFINVKLGGKAYSYIQEKTSDIAREDVIRKEKYAREDAKLAEQASIAKMKANEKGISVNEQIVETINSGEGDKELKDLYDLMYDEVEYAGNYIIARSYNKETEEMEESIRVDITNPLDMALALSRMYQTDKEYDLSKQYFSNKSVFSNFNTPDISKIKDVASKSGLKL